MSLAPLSGAIQWNSCSTALLCFLALTAVHCNLSQNGIDHQMCPEDVTLQLDEEEESVDAGPVLLDDDSLGYRDISPPMYQRRSPPHRSVSESELTRVGDFKAFLVNHLVYTTNTGKLPVYICSPGSIFPKPASQRRAC